jgi:hypothetical protein
MTGDNNQNLGELNVSAIYLHELYVSYIRAGFSNEQAFSLVTTTLRTMLQLSQFQGGEADDRQP